jgi:hypothetical protein
MKWHVFMGVFWTLNGMACAVAAVMSHSIEESVAWTMVALLSVARAAEFIAKVDHAARDLHTTLPKEIPPSWMRRKR